MLLYAAAACGVLGLTLVLFAIEGQVGAPPRPREWMHSLLSPVIAWAGLLASIPVVIALSLMLWPIRGQISEPLWIATLGAVVVTVGLLTARWWQPLYLGSLTSVFFTLGGLFEHYEAINEPAGQTVGDVVRFALQTALLVTGLASGGVLLRFGGVWYSRRSVRAGPRRPHELPLA